MAVVSRLELNHPDLGTAGGASLHTSIESLYEKIGDSVSSRWFAIDDFDQGETADLNHNFGTDINNLRFDLLNFTGGEWVKVSAGTTPSTSDFTIIEKVGDESDVLQITNNTGGDDLTFAVTMVFDPIYLSDGDVKDIDISGIADTQLLVYDSGTSKLVPSSSLENITLQTLVYGEESGAAATTITPTKAIFRATSGSQIDMIDSVNTKVLTLMNDSGGDIVLSNLTGATAANQIVTGTGGDITLNDQSSILLSYDSTALKYKVIGGAGSGGGLVNKTVAFGDSPVTGEIGTFYLVDTTGGEVIINQPEISTIPASQFEFASMIVADKAGNFHVNKCSVVAGGSDTQNYSDGTSDTDMDLDSQGATIGFNADSATSWTQTFGPYPSQSTSTTSGGEGGVNFFENPRFTDTEGLNNWSKTGDFSALSLVSGAAALEGNNSLTFTYDGAGTGEVIGNLRAVDPIYQGKLLNLTGAIQLTGTGTYTIKLIDSVTTDTIPGTEQTITGLAGTRKYDLQLACVINNANPPQFKIIADGSGVAADSFKVDILKLTPDGAGLGAIIGDWETYTPTFEALGNVTNIDVEYVQVGNNYFIRGSFTTDFNIVAEIRISLPDGKTVGGNITDPICQGYLAAASGTSQNRYNFIVTKGLSYLNLGFSANASLNALSVLNGNSLNNSVSYRFETGAIPIEEIEGTSKILDAGQIYDNSKLLAYDSTSTINSGSDTDVVFDNVDEGTLISGIEYVIPVTGKYEALFDGDLQTGTMNYMYLALDTGGGYGVLTQKFNTENITLIAKRELTVGDKIKVVARTNTGGGPLANANFSVTRIPDSSANQATGAGTSLIADETERALLMVGTKGNKVADGSFTAGSFKWVKIGDTVTIDTDDAFLLHTASASPSTTSGFLPVKYRPPQEKTNTYYHDTTSACVVYVSAAGAIGVRYRDDAGAPSRSDTVRPPSITYTVEG